MGNEQSFRTFSQTVTSLEGQFSAHDVRGAGALEAEEGRAFVRHYVSSLELCEAGAGEEEQELLAMRLFEGFCDSSGLLRLRDLVEDVDERELLRRARELAQRHSREMEEDVRVEKEVVDEHAQAQKNAWELEGHEEGALLLYMKLMLNGLSAGDVAGLPPRLSREVLVLLMQRPWLSCAVLQVCAALPWHAAVAAGNFAVSPVFSSALPRHEGYEAALDFFSSLPELRVGDTFTPPVGVVNPLRPQEPLRSMTVTRLFASGHAPCLVRLNNSQLAVLKRDDLRPDFATIRMFRVFDQLWRHSWLSSDAAHSLTFEVVPLSERVGLMEYVESEPLRLFDLRRVAHFDDEQMERFLCTMAGSLAACFVLGIRDRHRDNFMVSSRLEFWQLDFKHMFDRKTRGIDAPKLGIPRALKAELMARDQWRSFRRRLVMAWLTLRRNAGLISYMACHLYRPEFPAHEVEACINRAFFSHKTEEAASHALLLELDMSTYSLRKFLKNTIHEKNLQRMSTV